MYQLSEDQRASHPPEQLVYFRHAVMYPGWSSYLHSGKHPLVWHFHVYATTKSTLFF